MPRRPTVLRFSPTAWAKLLFLRDAGDTEIGGFGISAADDLLFVEDVQLVTQTCTWVHVEFDDEAVANFFDDQVDAGRRPEEFGRLWMHTHPGNSPEPSGTDEATFARVFGSPTGPSCSSSRGWPDVCPTALQRGPGADVKIPVEVDYSRPFAASEREAWQDEYLANVRVPPPEPPKPPVTAKPITAAPEDDEFLEDWWRTRGTTTSNSTDIDQEAEYGYHPRLLAIVRPAAGSGARRTTGRAHCDSDRCRRDWPAGCTAAGGDRRPPAAARGL